MEREDALYPKEPSHFVGRDIADLLVHTTALKASDVTIQTGNRIVAEVHGKNIFVTRRKLDYSEVSEIIANISGSEGIVSHIGSGRDFDSQYEVKPDRITRLRFRVNATQILVSGNQGIEITIRTIPTIPPSINDLGLEPEIFANRAPDRGMVLVTGATGSGKSTLLASIIRDLLEDQTSDHKILTYESPIEFVYDEIEKGHNLIAQTSIPQGLPSFAAGIRNSLRRSPSIILIGESRDEETIREAVTASMTGHLLFSTVHANSVSETVKRMINVFPPGEKYAMAVDIISSMRMIVSQMLLPSTDGKRVALREFLVFNDNIVDELLSDIDNITSVARKLVKQYGQPFIVDAQKKLDDGRISQHEFNKIKMLSAGADKDAVIS